MSDTKFTPGPWHVSGHSDEKGHHLHIGAKGHHVVLASMNRSHVHAEANAALIEAAPDIYEAGSQALGCLLII